LRNILYVRQKDDVFFNSFAKSLDSNQFKISIFDQKNGLFIDFTNNFSRILNHNSKHRILNYIQRYLTGIKFIIINKNNNFDIVHFLNIKRENFWLLPFFRKRTKKLILNVYGRSTYTSWVKKNLFRNYYKYFNSIVFTNEEIAKEFLTHYNHVDRKKIYNLYLPIKQFNKISYVESFEERQVICKRLGLDENLIHVVCSSTVARYDQHPKIIAELKKIVNKDKVELMFLLSYGGTEREKESIISLINKDLKEFKTKIFDKFLTEDEIADFRMCSDIYINMRTSDQLAGAIIESLYAGTLLISGSWLNYKKLDKLNIFYKKIDSFKHLSTCVDEIVKNFSDLHENYSKKNSKIIHNEFNFNKIISEWTELYQK